MRQRHRIVLTQSNIRAALVEYLLVHGMSSFPDNATLTYLGPKHLVYEKKSENDDLVVIVWEEKP